MADASELAQVRINTNTTDLAPFEDAYVNGLIDAVGVDGASAAIWRAIAATYSTKVDVTEAGASHKFSDLFKNAVAMAAKYDALVDGAVSTTASPRVNLIVRE